MHRFAAIVTSAIVFAVTIGSAPQPSSGPYKVLKTDRVGGEGGWDCQPDRSDPGAAARLG